MRSTSFCTYPVEQIFTKTTPFDQHYGRKMPPKYNVKHKFGGGKARERKQLKEARQRRKDLAKMTDAVASVVHEADEPPQDEDTSSSSCSTPPRPHTEARVDCEPSTSSQWLSDLSRSEKKFGRKDASSSLSEVREHHASTSGEADEEASVCANPERPQEEIAERNSVWCLANLESMNSALSGMNCPECQETECLQFKDLEDKKCGLSLCLRLECTSCYHIFSKMYTSPRSDGTTNVHVPFEVNDRFVLFLREVGLGYSALRRFCELFGMKPMTKNVYQRKQTRVAAAVAETTYDLLMESIDRTKEAHAELDPDFNGDISVSFDGTWHKRGHTSHYGVGAVIDVLTGLIVDYEVLSTYCHACSYNEKVLGTGTVAFHMWKQEHIGCCANYEGSSNSMEVEIAKRLWQRSERRGLRYVGFLTDGDSKAYNAVVEMKPYGDTEIQKEDCINHAHKRMGTALLNKAKEKKLGGRGRGRLTKEKALKFQYYYRFAIQNNAGDINAMRDAVFATLFHCMSTDDSPHHTRCPEGDTSWCFYQRAQAQGEEIPPHAENISHPLAHEVAQERVPVYRRMTDANLLKRLERAKTQNSNESFHSVIWSRCPKTVFVGKARLDGAVAGAVGAFNAGATHLSQVMLRLDLEASEVSMALMEARDTTRIAKARAAGHHDNKRVRKQRGKYRSEGESSRSKRRG